MNYLDFWVICFGFLSEIFRSRTFFFIMIMIMIMMMIIIIIVILILILIIIIRKIICAALCNS